MTRQELHARLSTIASVHQANNRLGVITGDTIILKRSHGVASPNNGLGHFKHYKIMCYVPDTSAVKLDLLLNKCISILKELEVEITNVFSEEFHDEELKAYTSFIEIRTPFVL